MKMRVLAALGAVGLSFALAGPAVAATVSGGHGADPHAYPISVTSTIAVSTQNPIFGQTITVTGENYMAGTSVKLDLVKQSSAVPFLSSVHTVALDSYSLGTASTNADGSFTMKVTMPGSSAGEGTYLVRGFTHYNGPQVPTQTVYLTAGGASGTGGANGNTGSNGDGGTAFTGLDIAGLVLLGVVLVAGGAVFAARGRKRVSA